MPCFHPITAWKSRTLNPSGRRSLVFDMKNALLGSELQVSCGVCIGCRLDRSQQWATRMMMEKKYHELSVFLTLTYAPDKLPERGTLIKKHMQDFWKRLRKKHGKNKLRYLYCGEYGDELQRPHYHAILFGCDFVDKKPHSKSNTGEQYYVSETLNKLWGHGFVIIGSVTEQSCAYVARYVCKKITGERAADHYGRVDPATGEWYMLLPEFFNMSTKPGIGFGFYRDFKSDLYPSDYFVSKGRKIKVPKYFDRKLEDDDPELLKKLKSGRKKRAALDASNNTPERLAVRKECLISKTSTLKRSI